MRFLTIIVLSVLAAITYGVLHDQVTARVCVEYFTVGHPRLIDSDDPTTLGLFWGVVATWWVGLPLGVMLAVAARAGRRPKLPAQSLVRPLSVLLLCMAVVAAIAGAVGYALATARAIWLVEPLASRVPAERHARFLTAGAAHLASYAGGFVGGAVLCLLTYRRRRGKLQSVHGPTPPPAAP